MPVQLGSHPLFRRLNGLRDNRIFRKGSEMAEDMRERWETSDSAMVQRLQVSTTLGLTFTSGVHASVDKHSPECSHVQECCMGMWQIRI